MVRRKQGHWLCFSKELLSEEIHNDKLYTKVEDNPINKQIVSYNKIISTLKPYLSKKEFLSLRPINRLKTSYGIVKMHKENHLLRLIVFHKILSPLKVKFSAKITSKVFV